MVKTVVISVRVPQHIVEKLRERGINLRKLMKEAILKEWVKDLAKELNELGKRIILPSQDELKKIMREGIV